MQSIKKVQVPFWIDEGMHIALKTAAAEEKTSVAEILRNCVQKYLTEQKNVKQLNNTAVG